MSRVALSGFVFGPCFVVQYLVSFLVELVAFTLIPFWYIVTVGSLCLFLAVPWIGLRSVFVAFPGHIHLLFKIMV